MARILWALAIVFSAWWPRAAWADEGLWPLDHLPREHLAQAYGFHPDAQWVRHAQLAAVRLSSGCSGSFVSPRGLVLTNRHCVEACVQQHSDARRDLARSGFLARTRQEEVRCDAIALDRLEEIRDVTAAVHAATAGRSGARSTQAESAVRARLLADCIGEDRASRQCELVAEHGGTRHRLYRYRRFQDVRLVFAPEDGAWPPCGNIAIDFPCASFDVAFLRAYDNARPAQSPQWLAFAGRPATAGEPVFSLGYPAFTERYRTVAQIERRRDMDAGVNLQLLAERRGMLERFADENPANARASLADRGRLRHLLERRRMQAAALRDPAFWAYKQARERQLRDRVDGDPVLKARYGDAWENIADAQRWLLGPSGLRVRFLDRGVGFDTLMFDHALTLVRGAAERTKPDGQRLKGFNDAELPDTLRILFADAPSDEALERAKLAVSLRQMADWLGPADPLVQEVLGPDAPDAVAKTLVTGSGLASAATRHALWDGGQAAVAASDDPMIRLARRVDPAARALASEAESTVFAVQEANEARIAQAAYEINGDARYPDADSTLRFSDGRVVGWTVDGAEIAPFATVDLAYRSAAEHRGIRLSERWLAARGVLDAAAPLNFVSANDIVGGNSGCPVVNARGELVGLVTAATVGGESGQFWYDARRNRAISVDGAAVLAVLDAVYGARGLVGELSRAPH